MRYAFFLAVTALGFCGGVRAADPPKLSADLALVPKDGLAFLSINVATVWENAAFKGVRGGFTNSQPAEAMLEHTGLKYEDLERVTVVGLVSGDENGPFFRPELITVLTARKPLDKAAIIKTTLLYTPAEVKAMIDKNSTWDKLPPPTGTAEATHYIGKDRGQGERVVAFVGDSTLVTRAAGRPTARPHELASPLELLKTTAETGALADGLALAAEHPITLAVNTTALKVALGRELPPEEVLPLLRADKVTGFVKLAPGAADVTLTATFAGNQWADDGEASVRKLKDLGTVVLKAEGKRMAAREEGEPPLVQFVTLLATTLERAKVTRADKAVTMAGRVDLGAKTQALLAVLPGATAESANLLKSSNNLKQIAIGFHAYHDVTGAMPTNIVDKDGKPLLSWRVHLLPYMEEAALYQQFKLDEPWDSANNKKLIEKMPPVYALPKVKTKEAGLTFYRGFIGQKGAALRPLFVEGEPKGMRMAGITDGTSNTILCVEAADPVTWTKPEDLPFDPNGKLPKLGGHLKKDSFQAAFCDGTVRNLSALLPEGQLKAYITPQGGEVIDEK